MLTGNSPCSYLLRFRQADPVSELAPGVLWRFWDSGKGKRENGENGQKRGHS